MTLQNKQCVGWAGESSGKKPVVVSHKLKDLDTIGPSKWY